MSLFEQISKDIMAAMKAKDKVRLEALRNVKKYFIEAKTAPGNNDELSDAEALKILAKLAKQSHESAALFQEKGRSELAEEELAQAAVIEGYLPKALTPEEIEKAVAAIIQETGATSMKEMGKVMGIASRQLAGKADGQHTGSVQGQVNQSVHQAAHNGRRNAVVVEGGDLFDDPAAQQQYQCCNSGCMVHVQIEFKHSILSSSLKISRTRKALHLPFR